MVERLRLDQIETPEFLDTMYALLADSARRNVLRYLTRHRKPVSVDRLAAELAAEDAVTDGRHAETALLLRHAHLPVLHETGLLEWDRTEDTVALTSLLDRLSVTMSSPDGLLGVSVATRPEPNR